LETASAGAGSPAAGPRRLPGLLQLEALELRRSPVPARQQAQAPFQRMVQPRLARRLAPLGQLPAQARTQPQEWAQLRRQAPAQGSARRRGFPDWGNYWSMRFLDFLQNCWMTVTRRGPQDARAAKKGQIRSEGYPSQNGELFATTGVPFQASVCPGATRRIRSAADGLTSIIALALAAPKAAHQIMRSRDETA